MGAHHQIRAFIRSPLAMGILTGKFDAETVLPDDDIGSATEAWRGYFHDAKVMSSYLERLAAIRKLVQTGGRSLPQGALCWLLAKPDLNIPLPGARTVALIVDNAGAPAHGRLPVDVRNEIETLIVRELEGPPRAR